MEMLVLLVFLVLAFVFLANVTQAWQRHLRERLRIVDEALKNDSLDLESKRELLRRLHPPSQAASWIFAAGWIGLFVGIGLMMTGGRDEFTAGCVTSAIGFAVISCPLAYREVQARNRA